MPIEFLEVDVFFMQGFLKQKLLIIISLGFFLVATAAFAELPELENNLYFDKTQLVTQQIELLNARLSQAQNEFTHLHQQESTSATLTIDHINKQLLNQTELDIAVAKSNLNSLIIELSESQQTILRLEKQIEEIEGQLNVSNVYRLKFLRNRAPNVKTLKNEVEYQKDLLDLEKERHQSLLKLQDVAENILQTLRSKYARISSLLKSQTIMQLKEQQAKSEIGFQKQESYWLKKLNDDYKTLNKLQASKHLDNNTLTTQLENNIFYANQNINFIYLKMLLARYQDQMQQLKVSIANSGSIALLDKAGDEAQLLGRQLLRVNDLLKNGLMILDKRKNFLAQQKENNNASQISINDFSNLENQYQDSMKEVVTLNQQLLTVRNSIDQALQQALASRQGLPGFSMKAWLDLGEEILLIPTLTFQLAKGAAFLLLSALYSIDYSWWGVLLLLEISWIILFRVISKILTKFISKLADHEFGHINLKWLTIKVLQRNLIDIAVITNVFWLFSLCQIPTQNFGFLIDLGFVWLVFKIAFTIARICLIETLHDRSGSDVILYHRLKWTFFVGGIITSLTVFMHQLPIIYEVKDLFDRLFLFFLFIVSILLLRSWEVLPSLILPHIDDRRTYLRRIIRLFCLLIPLVLLGNSVVGIFGFVNLVLTISWYQYIFLFVLVVYLLIRGLLIEGMEKISQILIRHTVNGWLWTEAFLKPIDKVLRVILFLFAWTMLFIFYGWDEQSPIVDRLNRLLHHHVIDVLNTSITPIRIIALLIVISLFYWCAKWTREFVYRLLHTSDLGVRNSIAILSQYTMIVIGLLICLRVLGIDFRALTVVAGMFAFGIGLGLRDIANNFVCGFLLLIERPVRVGDIVTVSGFEGEVVHIGGRAVTVRTWDHMEMLVPNSDIFSKSFINWTAKDNVVRTVITLQISRQDNPKQIQEIIYEVLNQHKDVLKNPAAEVFLNELTDGLVALDVRYYINLRQVESRRFVRSQVIGAIWDAFDQHGIKPPFPQRQIYITDNSFKTQEI